MAYWESFFNTSGDLPVAGCRASDDEWHSIKVPAMVIGGVDPVHPTEAAQKLHALLPNSTYHERLAPVWRDFIREREA